MQRCVLLCRWYRAALPTALLKEGACQHRREEHTAGCAVGGDVALKKDDTCMCGMWRGMGGEHGGCEGVERERERERERVRRR